MQQDDTSHYYRVVCSSGDTFFTKAKTTSEFVLEPVFIQFMVLSVILFTSLMLALELPAVTQVVLFGAVVVTTFIFLSLSIAIYRLVIEMFAFRTFYTPLLLFPMVVCNSIFFDYLLRLFGSSYTEGFNGFWEITIRTLIIIMSLDIFHAKFVAPQHRLAVRIDKNGAVIPLNSKPEEHQSTAPLVSAYEADVTHKPHTQNEFTEAEDAAQTDRDQRSEFDLQRPKLEQELRIGRETFDLADTLYIKSEGHYLLVQVSNQQKMVRGRLREVAAQIGPSLGLQVNRSVWIAYAAISSVQDIPKGQLEIELHDGSIIKVANSRKGLFEQGFGQYVQGNATRAH